MTHPFDAIITLILEFAESAKGLYLQGKIEKTFSAIDAQVAAGLSRWGIEIPDFIVEQDLTLRGNSRLPCTRPITISHPAFARISELIGPLVPEIIRPTVRVCFNIVTRRVFYAF